jgi:hypothetical protein
MSFSLSRFLYSSLLSLIISHSPSLSVYVPVYSLGMPMIVTGGICNFNMTSSAKDLTNPENQTPGAGVRVVQVSNISLTNTATVSKVDASRGDGTDAAKVVAKSNGTAAVKVDELRDGDYVSDEKTDDDGVDDGGGINVAAEDTSNSKKEAVYGDGGSHFAGFTHRYEVV